VKQQVFWVPSDIDLPKVTVVTLHDPSGEKIADSVMWAGERLGPSNGNGGDIRGKNWDFTPGWLAQFGSKDLHFYFGDEVDRDTIVLFKLTFGGR